MNRTASSKYIALAAALTVISGCANYNKPEMKKMAYDESAKMSDMPFSGPDSVDYAERLWSALEAAGMVGSGAAISKAYKGVHPHGAVLDTNSADVTVGGHTGVAFVKRNFGGEGVSEAAVTDDPNTWLKAVTVMYKRETGYDSDNKDWFWAKYLPDGSLDKNDKGMKLAGRVAKGKPAGCIACHIAAPGGDYLFLE